MASTIIIGTRVKFDSDHGPQAGTVTGFLKCIANGPRHATIEIDHELAGIVWTMPVSELQAVRRPPLANIDFANLNHMLGTVDTLAGDWGKRNWFSAGAGEQQESMQRLVAAGAVGTIGGQPAGGVTGGVTGGTGGSTGGTTGGITGGT